MDIHSPLSAKPHTHSGIDQGPPKIDKSRRKLKDTPSKFPTHHLTRGDGVRRHKSISASYLEKVGGEVERLNHHVPQEKCMFPELLASCNNPRGREPKSLETQPRWSCLYTSDLAHFIEEKPPSEYSTVQVPRFEQCFHPRWPGRETNPRLHIKPGTKC